MRKQRRKKSLQIQILASVYLKKKGKRNTYLKKVRNDLNLEFKFNLKNQLRYDIIYGRVGRWRSEGGSNRGRWHGVATGKEYYSSLRHFEMTGG